MELLLLGPVELRVGGQPVALGAPQQRAVLAMLALEAGRVVSADRLAEGLWGEDLPASRAKMVQQFVSHLRRALAGSGAEIVTRGRGYALDGLAAAAAALGQPERAARLAGAADAVFRTVGVRIQQFEADRREEVLSRLREELGPEALAAAMAQGATRIAPSPLTTGPGAGRT